MVSVGADMGLTISYRFDCRKESGVSEDIVQTIVAVEICTRGVLKFVVEDINQTGVGQEGAEVVVVLPPVAICIEHNDGAKAMFPMFADQVAKVSEELFTWIWLDIACFPH